MPDLSLSEQIEQAETELAACGPGWSLGRTIGRGPHDPDVWRAERAGTLRYEQAALDLDQLVKVVREREQQLSDQKPTVPVHTGMANTETPGGS
jgi:hypothetical protein